jgi:hypothetical protein
MLVYRETPKGAAYRALEEFQQGFDQFASELRSGANNVMGDWKYVAISGYH